MEKFERSTKAADLAANISKIMEINDPTTNADNIARNSNIALYILLILSGMLAMFGYFRFLSNWAPTLFAFLGALLIAGIIEFGKLWGATHFLRFIFFEPFQKKTPTRGIMMGFTFLLALITFAMSAYNSTVGTRHIANVMSFERNATAFTPNTDNIDKQLADIARQMKDAGGIKWKGTVTYEAQKSMRRLSEAQNRLLDQKTTVLSQQRADYERTEGQKDTQRSFASQFVLIIGGAIEAIQLVLLILCIAAQRELIEIHLERAANGQPSPPPSTGPQHTGHRNGYQYTNGAHYKSAGAHTGPQNTVEFTPTASFSAPNVATRSYTNADSVLREFRSKVSADVGNLRSGNGYASTVAQRIWNGFGWIDGFLTAPDFQPSPKVATEVYRYMVTEVIPELEKKGKPYAYTEQFLPHWERHIDRAELEKAMALRA